MSLQAMQMGIYFCLLVACMPLSVSAQDAQQSVPGIAWASDYGKAFALAKKEDRPLMIAFVLHDEPANVALMREHFKDPEIIALSRKFVCLAASPNPDEDIEGARSDGTTGQVARSLGAASGAEIMAIEKKARLELLGAHRVSCPQFLFMAPDGETILLRHVWMLPKAELLQKMRTALSANSAEPLSGEAGASMQRIASLMKAAGDRDASARQRALQQLSEVSHPEVLKFLGERTAGGISAELRKEVIFFAMGKRDNAQALSRLHLLLKDRDTSVRIHAAVAVGKIGLIDSAPHLGKALRGETQDRVRAHLIRALSECVAERSELAELLAPCFKTKNPLEAVALCQVAKSFSPTAELRKGLQGLLASRREEMRIGVYSVIGALAWADWKPVLEKQVGREKREMQDYARWALQQAGGAEELGASDPSERLSALFPDQSLWDGSFSL